MDNSSNSSQPELPEVTDELISQLAYRYADPQVCRLCGSEMKLARGGPDGSYVVCGGPQARFMQHEFYSPEYREAVQHYRESEARERRGDRHVMALIAEVRRLRNLERELDIAIRDGA